MAEITADAPSPALEFRSSDDDAWYSARLVLDEETLTVKFFNFGPDDDERFLPSDFNDLKSLDDFAGRVRPVSLQLQDAGCRRVIEGMTVCASHDFGDDEVKFYDAVVETASLLSPPFLQKFHFVKYIDEGMEENVGGKFAGLPPRRITVVMLLLSVAPNVYPSEHAFTNGEECLCQFVLFWQHGPNAGMKTPKNIENICLIQPGSAEKDPALVTFLEISRKKLEKVLHASVKPVGSTVNSEPNIPKSQKCHFKETRTPSQGHATETFTVFGNAGRNNVRKKIGQDMDLGSGRSFTKHLNEKRNYHYILIENLEKDLSPSSIVDFVYKRTSILSHAYVSPSLLSESYTRGTIFLETQEKLEKLSGFLHNPSHLIMSSRGRPWIIVEKEWRLGTFEGLLQKSDKKPPNKNEGLADNIKIVRKGTMEYEKGKQLSELFMEFSQHIRGLHKRLLLEEKKIIQSA